MSSPWEKDRTRILPVREQDKSKVNELAMGKRQNKNFRQKQSEWARHGKKTEQEFYLWENKTKARWMSSPWEKDRTRILDKSKVNELAMGKRHNTNFTCEKTRQKQSEWARHGKKTEKEFYLWENKTKAKWMSSPWEKDRTRILPVREQDKSKVNEFTMGKCFFWANSKDPDEQALSDQGLFYTRWILSHHENIPI